jgi:hypothetical protein
LLINKKVLRYVQKYYRSRIKDSKLFKQFLQFFATKILRFKPVKNTKTPTCRGLERSPDWRRPAKASCCNNMVEPGIPEAVVLVRATEPEPDAPVVEPVTMVGVEVETTPKAAVETTPSCEAGGWLVASVAGGSAPLAMVNMKQSEILTN